MIKYDFFTREFKVEEGGEVIKYTGIGILNYLLKVKTRETKLILKDAQIVLPWHRYRNDIHVDIEKALMQLIEYIEGNLKDIQYNINTEMREEVFKAFPIDWLIDEFSNRDSWDDAFIGWCMLKESITDIYSKFQEW